MGKRIINRATALFLVLTMTISMSIPAFASFGPGAGGSTFKFTREGDRLFVYINTYMSQNYHIAWYTCDNPGGTNENATLREHDNGSYYVSIAPEDMGKYLKVEITDVPSSSFPSDAWDYYYVPKTGESPFDIDLSYTALAPGKTIIANVLPDNATVTYKWYICNDQSGANKVAIPGATASKYIIPEVVGKYIMVEATGTGEYAGKRSAITKSNVLANEQIGPITFMNESFNKLIAVVEPYNPNLNYKWYRCDDAAGSNRELIKPTVWDSFVLLTPEDFGKYIEVAVSMRESEVVLGSLITAHPVNLPVELELNYSTLKLGDTITTNITPSVVGGISYQWYRSNNSSGQNWSSIEGATGSSYTITSADAGQYISVVVYLTGLFDGNMTRTTTEVAIDQELTGVSLSPSTSLEVNTKITASVTPSDATVTYKWYRCNDASGSAPQTIDGQNTSEYTIAPEDMGKYIKVEAIGTKRYAGSIVSKITDSTVNKILTDIGLSYTSLSPESIITANVMPSGATVAYQWYRCVDAEGSAPQTIDGQNTSSYTLTDDDTGKYIKVEATGTGEYAGSTVSKITPISVTDSTDKSKYEITGTVTTNILANQKNINVKMVNKTTGASITATINAGNAYKLNAQAGDYSIEFTTGGYLMSMIDNVKVETNAALQDVVMHAGDLIADKQIDISDYRKLISNLNRIADANRAIITEGNKYYADFNGDGGVDGVDLGILLSNIGKTTN